MINKCYFIPFICLLAWVGTLVPHTVFGTFLEGPFGSSPSQGFAQTHQLPVCAIQENPVAVLLSSGTCQSCPSAFKVAEKKPKEYGFTKVTHGEDFSFCPNAYSSSILESASNAIQNYHPPTSSEPSTWSHTFSRGVKCLSYAACITEWLGLMAYEAATQFLGFFSLQNLFFFTSKAIEKTFIRTLISHTFAFIGDNPPRAEKITFFSVFSYEVRKDIFYRISYVPTESTFFKAFIDQITPSSTTVNHILDGAIFNLWELPDVWPFQNFKISNMKSAYAGWRDVGIHEEGYFADWVLFSYKAGSKYDRLYGFYTQYTKSSTIEARQKLSWEFTEFLFGMFTKYVYKGKVI